MQEETTTAIRVREYFAVSSLIAFFIALNIVFHTLVCDTPMQGLTDDQWDYRFTVHLEVYPFFRRIPFTHLAYWFHQVTDWPLRQSFFFIQYFLLVIVSFVFYRFLRFLRISFEWAFCGVALILSAYPVLLGFTEPVHTWDDFWVYLALTLTVGALFKRKVMLAALAFTAALYAREQMLTYLPVYAAGVWLFSPYPRRWQKLLAMATPLILYLPFFLPGWTVPQPSDELRDLNWGTESRIANSVFSLLISFGVLWVTWLLGLARYFLQSGKAHTTVDRFIVWSSLYAAAVTVWVVMSVGHMRETRLFFPIFVYLIPISLYWLRDAAIRLAREHLWRPIIVVLVGAAGIYYGMDFAVTLFPDLDYRNCPEIGQGWFGVHIGLTAATLVAAMLTRFSVHNNQPSVHA